VVQAKKGTVVDDYYRSAYSKIHYRGILGLFTNGYHKKLESSKYVTSRTWSKILEVGAGSGEHLDFVEDNFIQYTLTDLEMRKPISDLLQEHGPKTKNRLRFQKANVENLPFRDESFDRVISTCLLHHLNSVEDALEEMRRVTCDRGLVSIYLPCDPGFLYRVIRHLFSHIKLSRHPGMNMQKVKHLWAKEHKNHFYGILVLIGHVFSKDEIHIKRYPFPFFSWNFNLFLVLQIKIDKQVPIS
jgi:phosphatidylethanolamine/phosphatidyl-N-methylethanolamine N-methyltransferase